MLSSAIPGPVEENLSNPKRCTTVLALATYGLGRSPGSGVEKKHLARIGWTVIWDMCDARFFCLWPGRANPPEKQHAQIHQPEPVQQQTEFQEGIEVAQS